MDNKYTTITITKDMQEKLKSFRKYSKESYEEIINRLLGELQVFADREWEIVQEEQDGRRD